MKPIQNQYQDLLEGKMSKSNFLTNVKRSLTDYVSNVTSFDDAVKILKNKRIIHEGIHDKDILHSPHTNVKSLEQSPEQLSKAADDRSENILRAKYSKQIQDPNISDDELRYLLSGKGVKGFGGTLNAINKIIADRNRTGEMPGFEGTRDALDKIKINEDWGSSDQDTFNRAIHKDLGEPTKMPMPFDTRFEAAVTDAVDFWWDEWDEYVEDRDGLIDHAKKLYYRAYFPKDFEMLTQMFSETKEEDDAIIATYDDEQDAKHTLPGGHLREHVDINGALIADIDKVNPLEYNTGIDYELDLSGDFSAEGLEKAVKKVLKNLAKDTIYYTNLKASLTQKINKKQVVATELVQVKKDNHTDELNKLKTLVKKEMANTKTTLGKKEKASSATPKGVKLMKEEEGKFDLNKYNKDLFKKQSKEFTDKLTKPVTQKNTLKDKIKEYVTKQLKKEAVKFTIGQTGQEHEYKNPKDAPEFEKDLRSAGVKFVKSNV